MPATSAPLPHADPVTRSSWLQQPVPLGPFTMPGGMVLYVLLCAGVVAALNGCIGAGFSA